VFHNSTTLHRINPQFRGIARENRVVHGFVESAGAKWASFVVGAKKAGRVARVASWSFGGPLMWKTAKLGGQAAKKVYSVGEWGGLTGIEAGKGVWGMTGKPLGTLGLSIGKDISMNLWPGKQEGGSVPRSVIAGIPNLAGGLLFAPFRALNGIRKGITNIFTGGEEGKGTRMSLSEIALAPLSALGSIDITSFSGFRQGIKNVLTLPFKAVNGVRKRIQSVISPPITEPLAPILAPPKEVISAAARSKIQYLLAMQKAGRQIKEGAHRFWNSPDTARAQQAVLWQTRTAEAAAKEQAAQQENVTNLSDSKKKKGASERSEGGKQSKVA